MKIQQILDNKLIPFKSVQICGSFNIVMFIISGLTSPIHHLRSSKRWNPQSLHGLLTVSTFQFCGHQSLDTKRSSYTYLQSQVLLYSNLFKMEQCIGNARCKCVTVTLKSDYDKEQEVMPKLWSQIYLGLRDELCDLLAGVEWSHLHMGHSPVSSTLCVQNLVMFL